VTEVVLVEAPLGDEHFQSHAFRRHLEQSRAEFGDRLPCRETCVRDG
jgi:hypothetical protein